MRNSRSGLVIFSLRENDFQQIHRRRNAADQGKLWQLIGWHSNSPVFLSSFFPSLPMDYFSQPLPNALANFLYEDTRPEKAGPRCGSAVGSTATPRILPTLPVYEDLRGERTPQTHILPDILFSFFPPSHNPDRAD